MAPTQKMSKTRLSTKSQLSLLANNLLHFSFELLKLLQAQYNQNSLGYTEATFVKEAKIKISSAKGIFAIKTRH